MILTIILSLKCAGWEGGLKNLNWLVISLNLCRTLSFLFSFLFSFFIWPFFSFLYKCTIKKIFCNIPNIFFSSLCSLNTQTLIATHLAFLHIYSCPSPPETV